MSLPTKQAAVESEAWLAENAHAPALFEKLSSAYGIRPRNQTEARQLLQMGATLAAKHRAGQYKTAAEAKEEEPNPFLGHALGALSVAETPAATRYQESYIKQAALELVRSNPIAKTAGLVYGHALQGGEFAEEPQGEEAGGGSQAQAPAGQ